MTKVRIVLACMILSLVSPAIAQNHTKYQVGFVSPIGTNGTNSINYINDYSFNLLIGINGGVNKMEVGGLANYNKGKTTGFQLAGVTNVTRNKADGCIIAGVANLIIDDAKGFQLSGVSNINSRNSNGVMISGVANITKENAKGFQLSTANITKNKLNGVQIGTFNYAKILKGSQIGVFNLVDSLESGTPIGLFSIVKGGYYALEISTNDVIHANLNYKMGVEHFYTLFTVGFDRYKGKDLFKYGTGFGSLLPIGQRYKLSIEATSNQLVYDNDWSELNLLNSLQTNFHFHFTPQCSLFAGPTLNAYITNKKVGEQYGTIDIPHTIYDHTSSKNKLFVWIGFNAGVSFQF
ncbi:LA_2272 family surface repeat-containing protein [Labilibaculum euxinus]